MLGDLSVHVSSVRSTVESNLSWLTTWSLAVIEPHIGSVLAASATERAIFVAEAIVREVVMLKSELI